jgi:hypothetical protein
MLVQPSRCHLMPLPLELIEHRANDLGGVVVRTTQADYARVSKLQFCTSYKLHSCCFWMQARAARQDHCNRNTWPLVAAWKNEAERVATARPSKRGGVDAMRGLSCNLACSPRLQLDAALPFCRASRPASSSAQERRTATRTPHRP